ncbi:MAG TPA: hypothetical protein VGD67_13900, partial [Pseudonocardiaceae bacterium]
MAAGELRLASFDSCDTALAGLKRAILPHVGPYGLAGNELLTDLDGAPPPVAAERAPAADSADGAAGA